MEKKTVTFANSTEEKEQTVMCSEVPMPTVSEKKDPTKRTKNPPTVPRQSAKPDRNPFAKEKKPPPKDTPEGKEFYAKQNTGSAWRQLTAVLAVNLVTLLQGASLPTSSISTVQLANVTDAADADWPRDFRTSELENTFIGLSWLFGHLVAGVVANPVAEILGRRRSLMLDTVVFSVGFFVYAGGESVAALCAGRVLLGYPLVSTVYICELVHPEMRGVAAAVYATSHALGYSLILLLGATVPHWRVAVATFGALAVAPTLLALYFVPESPVWLLRRDRVAEAEISLKKMRGPDYDVEDELEDLKAAVELNNCRGLPLTDILRLMWCKKFRLPFSFLLVLYLALGWSGFTYLALNGVELFQGKGGGSGGLDSYFLNFLVSLIKIPGGLFAALFLKKFPRRPVFASTALLVVTGHLLMAWTFLGFLPKWCAVLALTFAFFGYSAGYNSVAALLLGEILPANLRSVGVGLIATAEVLSALSQTASTAPVEDAVGKSGLFLIFAAVVFATFVFSFTLMPETSGLTLEQIENIWQSEKEPGCCVRRDPKEEIRRMSVAVVTPAVSVTNRVVSVGASVRRWSMRPDAAGASNSDAADAVKRRFARNASIPA